MAKGEQDHSQEGQEQHLVGNGLLQVTVTALILTVRPVVNGVTRLKSMFLQAMR